MSRSSAATTLHPTTPAAATLSVRRLNVMRLGYLIMAVGLAVTQWPLLVNRDEPWPLMDGVVTCMLIALSLLSLLGLRHPVRMLPILVFEAAWKVLWLTVVALPLWVSDQMDPATLEVTTDLLWVVMVLAVVPWRWAVAQCLTKPGDPWRRS
jgi:hypothetical protein